VTLLTPDQVREQHPEIIAICEQLRAVEVEHVRRRGGNAEDLKRARESVRFRCLHDEHGVLIAGKLPDDMAPPGPVPSSPVVEPERPQLYRGRTR
jgi:hypothetical protein